MDNELERELAAMRRGSDVKRAQDEAEFRAGKDRIKQFADVMRKNGVPPLPMLALRKVKKTGRDEGRPGGVFRKAIPPSTYEFTADEYYLVDGGWPIGSFNGEVDDQPYDLKRAPAVTIDGRLRKFEYRSNFHMVGDPKPSEYTHIEAHVFDTKQIWWLDPGDHYPDSEYRYYGSRLGFDSLMRFLHTYTDNCPWNNPVDGGQRLFIRPKRQ